MDFHDVLQSRRAVNFFDPNRDVPEDTLRQMLETASRAPSSFNLQPWKVAVLRDPDAKARLRALAWDQPKVTEAPVILIFLADTEAWKSEEPGFIRQFSYLVEIGRYKPGQKNDFARSITSIHGQNAEQSLAFAVKNTAFFAMTFMYVAANAGFRTHPMDGFDHEGVRATFGISKRYWIPLLMAVGHLRPGVVVAPDKWRFSPEEFLYSIPLPV